MYFVLFIILLCTAIVGLVLHAFCARLIRVASVYLLAIVVPHLVFALLSWLASLLGYPISAEVWLVGLLFVAFFSLTYIFILVGVVNDSPTLAIVKLLMNKNGGGASQDDLSLFIAQHPFVSSRIKALGETGDIVLENGQIKLTRKSEAIVTILGFYKRLLISNGENG